MVARVETVAFEGIEARPVDVQVELAPGLPGFTLVGLPDKAVAESRERVRAALTAIGLALPPRRIVVNLAPADLPKEGSHFDLAIALGTLVLLGVVPADAVERFVVMGELALDGTVSRVAGVLPAAIAANRRDRGMICPQSCGPEAAWAGFGDGSPGVIAPRSLIQLVNHIKGTQTLAEPEPGIERPGPDEPDLADVKGQETAKRALEIAAAGGHNLLMTGPPGAGKSMLARRLPGLLPALAPDELLELSMIESIAGVIEDGRLSPKRPFRAPHHSASMAALVGGGQKANPGEVSLAHNGVLFLDELPEFQRPVLDALREPLETGHVVVARANAHVTYPARFQLVAAMNPCRCGYADAGGEGPACTVPDRCKTQYAARLSGPLLDRIDLRIDVPAVSVADLAGEASSESSADVAERVALARRRQAERYRSLAPNWADSGRAPVNATADGRLIEQAAGLDAEGRSLLIEAAEAMGLTARGYHRVLRLARTLADLEGSDKVARLHLAEAIAYRGADRRRTGVAAA